MSNLILVRHGKSIWNVEGRWQGKIDDPLHPDGIIEAKEMAVLIKDLRIDKIYTSKLIRAIDTEKTITKELNINPPVIENEALNEKDYGIYDGKNKWEVKKQVGEEKFQKIRRGWNYPIPQGETLEDVYNRIVPYFNNQILPDLKKGENILISAHGNSLRALIKYLNNLTVEEVEHLEFGIGEIYVFKIDESGKVVSFEIRGENPEKGKI